MKKIKDELSCINGNQHEIPEALGIVPESDIWNVHEAVIQGILELTKCDPCHKHGPSDLCHGRSLLPHVLLVLVLCY